MTRRFALALILTVLVYTIPPAAAQEHGAAPHGEAAAGHEGGGEHSDLSTWKWLNFAILAGLLGWAISKNAGPFFDARIAGIQREINEAKEVRQEAEARAAAIEQRLANLDTELVQMRTDARREMEAEGDRIQDETRRLVTRASEQATQEIATMSKAAENELRIEAGRLALELAENKLKARMSPEADGSLVGRFVAGLGAVSRN